VCFSVIFSGAIYYYSANWAQETEQLKSTTPYEHNVYKIDLFSLKIEKY